MCCDESYKFIIVLLVLSVKNKIFYTIKKVINIKMIKEELENKVKIVFLNEKTKISLEPQQKYYPIIDLCIKGVLYFSYICLKLFISFYLFIVGMFFRKYIPYSNRNMNARERYYKNKSISGYKTDF